MFEIAKWRDKARNWHLAQLKRGYMAIESRAKTVDTIAYMLYECRQYNRSSNGVDLLSIDHVISKVATLHKLDWHGLSTSARKDWAAFIKEWEHVGRVSKGEFQIASGLHCSANLHVMPKRANGSKGRCLRLHDTDDVFLGLDGP